MMKSNVSWKIWACDFVLLISCICFDHTLAYHLFYKMYPCYASSFFALLSVLWQPPPVWVRDDVSWEGDFIIIKYHA